MDAWLKLSEIPVGTRGLVIGLRNGSLGVHHWAIALGSR
jgi:hypothetical protein